MDSQQTSLTGRPIAQPLIPPCNLHLIDLVVSARGRRSTISCQPREVSFPSVPMTENMDMMALDQALSGIVSSKDTRKVRRTRLLNENRGPKRKSGVPTKEPVQ